MLSLSSTGTDLFDSPPMPSRIPVAQDSAAGCTGSYGPVGISRKYFVFAIYVRGTLVSLVFGEADFMVFIEYFVIRNGTAHPDLPAALFLAMWMH